MDDGVQEQGNPDESTKTGREIDLRSGENCARKLWLAALAKGQGAKETFWFKEGKPESQQPSDWLIIFTLKQLMRMPEFLRKELKLDATVKSFSAPEIDGRIKAAVGKRNKTTGLISLRFVREVLKQPNPRSSKDALASLNANKDTYRIALTAELNRWREKAGATTNLTVDELFEPNKLKSKTYSERTEEFNQSDAISLLRSVATRDLKIEQVRQRRRAEAQSQPGEKDDANWLAQPDSIDGPLTFADEGKKDARAAKLSTAASFLFGKDSGQALLNCHSDAMRSGLTGLVAELFKPQHRNQHDCQLPMLYVPLHGRSRKPPDDSLGSLILKIRNFYQDLATSGLNPPTDHPGSKPEPMNADRMSQLVAETRDLMTRHPAILVFDGYRTQRHSADARDYSLFHLRAAIAEDHVFDLIEQLLMIPTPRADHAIDVAAFRNNRFLITSDFPLFASDGNALHPHPVLKLLEGKSIEIDLPAASAFPEILAMFGNQSPEQRAMIQSEILDVRHLTPLSFRHDFEQHTELLWELANNIFGRPPRSEGIYGALSTLLKLGMEEPYPSLGGRPESDDLSHIVAHQLIPKLQSCHDGRWLILLHFVAIAPGGLRPRTLARVYEDYREVAGDPLSVDERNGLKHEIADMLGVCNGVIGLCRSDGNEALSDHDLPMLHRERYGFGREEIPCDRAIMFAFNSIREAFIQDACLRDGGSYVSLLHLLLAEEAFDQHLQMSRYDGRHVDDSLLRHNRLLAGLYHGAASLVDDKMVVAPLHAGAGRFLPDEPQQRLIKLYTFVFRKMLDRPPLYALIRHYDAAGLKLDLLLLLLKPQLWRWQQARPDLPSLSPSFGPKCDRIDRLQREFRADILKASSKTLIQLNISIDEKDVMGEDYVFRDKIERSITLIPLSIRNRPRDVGSIPKDIISHLDTRLAQGRNIGNKIDDLSKLTQSLVLGVNCASELQQQAQDFAVQISDALTTKDMKILADLINLFADATGVEADRVFKDGQSDRQERYEIAATEQFSSSFAAFYLAETIRMDIFAIEPTKFRDTIGGSAGRGFIRVCLKLERQRQRYGAIQGFEFQSRGWFWMQAQNISAHLARYLSPYPRERAGMLILDSALARHCAPFMVRKNHIEDQVYLKMALASLRKCEPVIQNLSRHSRLRQRFLLERSKVMAGMARIHSESDRDLALQYIEVAETDISSVKKLALQQNELWQGIADRQMSHLMELRKSLTLRPFPQQV
jgi:hypothetical protein